VSNTPPLHNLEAIGIAKPETVDAVGKRIPIKLSKLQLSIAR